jgi:hypothetical protein
MLPVDSEGRGALIATVVIFKAAVPLSPSSKAIPETLNRTTERFCPSLAIQILHLVSLPYSGCVIPC